MHKGANKDNDDNDDEDNNNNNNNSNNVYCPKHRSPALTKHKLQ
jgi:hypothetical protein